MNPAYTALVPSLSSTLLRDKITQHIDTWSSCTRCSLRQYTPCPIIGKGSLPCDILLIGEYPKTEDNNSGLPFTDKDGQLLDTMLSDVRRNLKKNHKIVWNFSVAATNLVACLPSDGKQTPEGYKARPPLIGVEVSRCSDRLSQFIELAAPKGIVLFGPTATAQAKRTINRTYIHFPKEKRPEIISLQSPGFFFSQRKIDSSAYTVWMRTFTSLLKRLYGKHHGNKN